MTKRLFATTSTLPSLELEQAFCESGREPSSRFALVRSAILAVDSVTCRVRLMISSICRPLSLWVGVAPRGRPTKNPLPVGFMPFGFSGFYLIPVFGMPRCMPSQLLLAVGRSICSTHGLCLIWICCTPRSGCCSCAWPTTTACIPFSLAAAFFTEFHASTFQHISSSIKEARK